MYIYQRLNIKAATLFLLIIIALETKAQQRRLPPVNFEEFRTTLKAKASPEEKLPEYAFMSLRAERFYPDSLVAFAKEIEGMQGINESQKRGFKNFILAHAWRMRNRDSTIFYAQKASAALKKAEANKEYILTANLLGIELSREDKFVEAESTYRDGIEFAGIVDAPSQLISQLYGNLASLYSRVGLYDKAIEMYQFFLGQQDSPGNRCNAISQMAQSMIKVNELEKANKLLSSCLEYSQLPPPIKSIVRSNLSTVLDKQGRTDESVAYMEEAASISIANRIGNLEFSQPLKLGDRYLKLNNIVKADSVFQLVQALDFSKARPEIRINRSIFFAKLAEAKGQHQQAVQYAEEAIGLAEGTNQSHFLRADVYTAKANAHEAMGELEESLESLRRQRKLQESLDVRSGLREEAMMKVRYQLQNKEDQLTEISAELGTVKTRTAVIILVIILAGLYAAYRYRLHHLLKEEKTRNRIAGDLHDEVSASLSSISFFADAITRDDPSQKDNRFVTLISESAGDAKDKITDIIWAINPEQDSWQALFAKCQRYASDLLESKGIAYNFDIADGISGKPDMETKQNFWLIFKEMLTNIARHSEAKDAKISIGEDGHKLSLAIQDNGKGFDTNESFNGNGLKNIYRRAEKIDAEIVVNSDPQKGTHWKMKLNK